MLQNQAALFHRHLQEIRGKFLGLRAEGQTQTQIPRESRTNLGARLGIEGSTGPLYIGQVGFQEISLLEIRIKVVGAGSGRRLFEHRRKICSLERRPGVGN